MTNANAQTYQSILVGLAVVVLVLVQQLRRQPVKTQGARLMVILGGIGLLELAGYLAGNNGTNPDGTTINNQVGPVGFLSLVISLCLAAVLSWARAGSVHIWETDSGWMRQGTWIAGAWWLLSIGSHFGIEAVGAHIAGKNVNVGGLAGATLVLYLAISLGMQAPLIARRAAREVAAREQR